MPKRIKKITSEPKLRTRSPKPETIKQNLKTSNPKPETLKPQTTKSKPIVSIIMGSDSDLVVMKDAAEILEEFGIAFEVTIVSAHRTPKRMVEYAGKAHERGIKVIIAGAGGAAHLPGMVASITPLPVIGVPVKSSNSIDGWDSILSILQMPNGVPVATVALNAAKNAGILAAEILGSNDAAIQKKIIQFKSKLKTTVEDKAKKMEKEGYRKQLK